MYQTILVPLDGSEVTPSILEPVAELARGCGAQLLLLTVGPTIPAVVPGAAEIQLTVTFQAEDQLDRLRVSLAAEGLKVATMVRIGDPASEILSVAESQPVDLIMIKSQGGEGTTSPFWGSVAAKVAGTSSVPVWVFHSGSAQVQPA